MTLLPKNPHLVPIILLVVGIILPFVTCSSFYQGLEWDGFLFFLSLQFFNIIPALFLIGIWYGLKWMRMPKSEWITILLAVLTYGFMGYQYHLMQDNINQDALAGIGLIIIPLYTTGLLGISIIFILILFLIYLVYTRYH